MSDCICRFRLAQEGVAAGETSISVASWTGAVDDGVADTAVVGDGVLDTAVVGDGVSGSAVVGDGVSGAAVVGDGVSGAAVVGDGVSGAADQRGIHHMIMKKHVCPRYAFATICNSSIALSLIFKNNKIFDKAPI